MLSYLKNIALVSALMATVSACQTPQQHAASIAKRGRLETMTLHGSEFELRAYTRLAHTSRLFVFLDGDGSPWLDAGTRISSDPTPRAPLALELATHTPGAVLYLGRPCYFEHNPACISDLWTTARYSNRVVDSMAAALNHYVAERGFDDVILIGYSGGGALGALMAPRVPGVTALLTIAANLDTDAWTHAHSYRPLTGSLNPAHEAPLAIREWHVVGARDTNVPPSINRAYFERLAPDRVWSYADADHACCWVALWPQILARLQADLTP